MTTYHLVGGRLQGFIRDNALFTVVSDALGHVRRVLDGDGTLAASFEYDAWGNELAATDDVPGGFTYRYVGAYGVRYDADTGLHYMRQRWYDAGLQRFVSTDTERNLERYIYARDQPTLYSDPTGLTPTIGPLPPLEQLVLEYKKILADELAKNPDLDCSSISVTLKDRLGSNYSGYKVGVEGIVQNSYNPDAFVHYAAVVYDAAGSPVFVLDPIPGILTQTVSPAVYWYEDWKQRSTGYFTVTREINSKIIDPMVRVLESFVRIFK